MRIIPKSKAPARSGARPSELAAFVAELLTAVRVQDSTATPAFRLSRAIDALGKLSNSKLSVEDENQLRQRRRLKVSERLGSWIQSGALGTLILGMFFSGISAPIVSAIHDHVHFLTGESIGWSLVVIALFGDNMTNWAFQGIPAKFFKGANDDVEKEFWDELRE
jgi:hypothetical protein